MEGVQGQQLRITLYMLFPLLIVRIGHVTLLPKQLEVGALCQEIRFRVNFAHH